MSISIQSPIESYDRNNKLVSKIELENSDLKEATFKITFYNILDFKDMSMRQILNEAYKEVSSTLTDATHDVEINDDMYQVVEICKDHKSLVVTDISIEIEEIIHFLQ